MELCLGTVRFDAQHNMPQGQPDAQEAGRMLAYAAEHGVGTVDTSSAYGNAERIVGKFIATGGELQIVIKLRPGILYNVQPENYHRVILQNVRESLHTMNVRHVEVVLFHNAEYVKNEQALQALSKLKRDRTTQKTGICVSVPAELNAAIQSPDVDLIQLPYSLLDRRMDGLLKKARQEIYACNPFLQGLLLMDEQELPQKYWDIKPYLHRIDAFCERNGVTRLQLLVNYLKLQPAIDKMVFGAASVEHVRRVVEAYAQQVDEGLMRDLADEFAVVEERILMPSLWHGEYG